MAESVTIIGVDTGGTFTDFVAWEQGRIRTHKEPSTPQNPADAILSGLHKLDLDKTPSLLIHGSTVATNAVLENKGCRVAYICNQGFADVLTLGRQQRPHLFRLQQPPVEAPVPPEYCIPLQGRIDSQGRIIEALNPNELERLATYLRSLQVDAVAVNLLFSFLRPDQEQTVAEHLQNGWFISQSHEVLPEIKEYERGIATWLNAYVGPLMQRYLSRLQHQLPAAAISVMRSDGSTIAAAQSAKQSVRLLLSGPAGGLSAARHVGDGTGQRQLMTFDMGGTSTDVALLDGELQLADSGRIAGYPVAVPSVDVHTIGAGGGSLALVDAGGMLKVGPESAGAVPGPACYGKGGSVATVTDAHLVLGRIPRQIRLGGDLSLDLEAARGALQRLGDGLGCSAEDAALGVIRVANEHMIGALRVISVEQGHDPVDYSLMSFGGAGGLHVCDLADGLAMRRAIVPRFGGVLSALGMLVGKPGRVLSRGLLRALDQLSSAELEAGLAELEQQGREQLASEGVDAGLDIRRQVLLRYRGQSQLMTFSLQSPAALEQAYLQRYRETFGYLLDLPIEVAEIRVHLNGPERVGELPRQEPAEAAPGQTYLTELGQMVPCLHRSQMRPSEVIAGPAIMIENLATTYVAPGWSGSLDSTGHLLLNKI